MTVFSHATPILGETIVNVFLVQETKASLSLPKPCIQRGAGPSSERLNELERYAEGTRGGIVSLYKRETQGSVCPHLFFVGWGREELCFQNENARGGVPTPPKYGETSICVFLKERWHDCLAVP